MIDYGNRGILILSGWSNDALNTEWFDSFHRPIPGPIMLNKHQSSSAVRVNDKKFISM